MKGRERSTVGSEAAKRGGGGRAAGKPVTVSELVLRVTRLLNEEIGRVKVEGEISNFSLPRSGHAYFALKDAEATIQAVCFRHALARVSMELADGKKVEVTGRVTAYAPRSQYQIVVESIREAGVGDLIVSL